MFLDRVYETCIFLICFGTATVKPTSFSHVTLVTALGWCGMGSHGHPFMSPHGSTFRVPPFPVAFIGFFIFLMFVRHLALHIRSQVLWLSTISASLKFNFFFSLVRECPSSLMWCVVGAVRFCVWDLKRFVGSFVYLPNSASRDRLVQSLFLLLAASLDSDSWLFLFSLNFFSN